MNKTLRSAVALATSASLLLGPWAALPAAAASSSRPQVVIAIGNSESMDGNLSGAIMAGSGTVGGLGNSSSPVDFSVPSGFTPPLTPLLTASAPYTVNDPSTGYATDNSPSRLNVAKQGINQVLTNYLSKMDFALEDYKTGSPTAYSTWVYYMSPSGGFQFANTLPTNGFTSYADYQAFVTDSSNAGASPAATRWVSNPCYGYGSSTSSTVKSNCTSLASLYGASTLSGNLYMQIAASSDDPNINDVLYTYGGYAAVGVAYNGPSPSNPYTAYSLADYVSSPSNILSSYKATSPSNVVPSTYPTNAGFIPFSPQVMYAQRGFGYGASQSHTTGNTVVGMTTVGVNGVTVSSALNSFQAALKPETASTSSKEIKASAGQAATAGLLQGAGSLLPDSSENCAQKYVILVTDGLPTMDLNGGSWPPLGSASGQGYGVYASFYGVSAQAAYGIKDDSGNSGGATGALDAANTNDQALIDTITAIQNLKARGIKTYVIGLGAGVDSSANPAAYYALNAMAIAGGTDHEYPASNVLAFESAMDNIATSISGAVIAAAPAVPGYVQNGSLAYLLASDSTYGNQQGLFEAFSTDASGNVSNSAAWTLQMTAAQRMSDLFTDQGSGTAVQLLANTPASAFGNPTSPTAQTIIDYTIDPSYNGGQYLAGRASGSFLGTVTSQGDKPLILSRPNNPDFITSASYASFAKNNASRTPLVLFTSNDGMLYAVSAGTATTAGSLQWAWMPSVFLPQLQNYTTFQSTQPMAGGFKAVDSTDAGGNWATYVVGTGEGGGLHYDVKLSGCTSSSSACTPTISKVWYDQQSNASSPPQAAAQAPSVWWDNNDVAYAAYFTTVGSTSYLNVMRLYDGSTSKTALGFTPTSAAYVDTASQKLYVGDGAGNVWSFDLSTGSTASTITGPTLVGTAPNETGSGAVRYVGMAQTSTGLYLWATHDHQIDVFKFTGGSVASTTTGWTLWWWSGIGGSGYYSTTSGAMVTTSSDPGVGSTTQPYWLESGSTITDSSAVQASTLIVPVTVTPSDSCAVPTAKYDFFDLNTGTFPAKKFYDLNKNYLTSNPVIGIGTAYSPSISQNGSGSALVYGTASQNLQGKIGFQVAATSGIHVGPGVVGWQPLWLTQP